MNVFTKSLVVLAMVAWVGAARADDKSAEKVVDKSAEKAEKVADKSADKAEKTADKAADKAGDAETAAAKEKGANKGKGVRGTVVKVDGMALTVTTKGPDGVMQESVVTTDDKTIIVLDGKPGKLADLKQGQQVMVMAAEGDKPARIQARTPGQKKGDAQPAAGEKKAEEKKSEKEKADK